MGELTTRNANEANESVMRIAAIAANQYEKLARFAIYFVPSPVKFKDLEQVRDWVSVHLEKKHEFKSSNAFNEELNKLDLEKFSSNEVVMEKFVAKKFGGEVWTFLVNIQKSYCGWQDADFNNGPLAGFMFQLQDQKGKCATGFVGRMFAAYVSLYNFILQAKYPNLYAQYMK